MSDEKENEHPSTLSEAEAEAAVAKAAPVGGSNDTSSPSPELNSAVVTRPGNGFLTHLITSSMNFLFSGCEAI